MSVKISDVILVYIPNSCVSCEEFERLCCPLQVALRSSSTTVGYFNGSDEFDNDAIASASIRDLELVNVSVDLNVLVVIDIIRK